MAFRLTLIFLLLSGLACAQTFSGIITYDLSYTKEGVTIPPEHLPSQVVDMISELKVRTEQNTQLGTQVALFNASDSSYVLLVEFVDEKIAILMPDDYGTKTGKPKPTIKYKCKSKKIGGYKCKLAIVTYPGESPVEVYYTKKIPAQLSQKFEGLKGFPLAFDLQLDGLMQHQEASQIVEKTVPGDLFEIPDDYRQMTMEEFQKSLGY